MRYSIKKIIRRRSPVTQRSYSRFGSSDNTMRSPINQQSLLLLQYDDFYVSKDGVTRTFYQMDGVGLSIEEIHDMKRAEKDFSVRVAQRNTTRQHRPEVGPFLSTIHIQEIDEHNENEGAFETGATTWETSIAASMYFSSEHIPYRLHGDVIELGSGVGFGGIMTVIGPLLTHTTSYIHSITFTDYFDDALKTCQLNIHRAFSAFPTQLLPQTYVTRLDWNDFLQDSSFDRKTYDTVIAYDCAYRHSDVKAISTAAKCLLRKNNSSRIHFIGPINRAVLYEVAQYLREELCLHVETNVIDMNRYRLRPGHHFASLPWREQKTNGCNFQTHTTCKFLQVTAYYPCATDDAANLVDID